MPAVPARRPVTALLATVGLVGGLALTAVTVPVLALPASAATRSQVALGWPGSAVYVNGAPRVQGGIAPASRARTVLLQQNVSGTWKTVASTRTERGVFGLVLPTSAPGKRTFRVYAPAGSGGTSVISANRAITVKASNPRAFALSSQNGPSDPVARWNTCDGAIGWRINAGLAPPGALADTKGALARISAVSGLRFVYRGTTSILPGAPKQARYPTGTQLVIAWAKPGQSANLSVAQARAGVTGSGGATWISGYVDTRKRPAYKIISGNVVLDGTKRLATGFGTGPAVGAQGTWGQLLMHEIGHAVGLDHPAGLDTSQIMYPQMSAKLAVWGAGDVNGLTAIGLRAGCLTPDPARFGPTGLTSQVRVTSAS